MEKTVRIRASGRVQGVGFRAWASKQAESLGLNGWVRNRKDGTVEAVFSAEESLVDAMLKLCQRGPMAAKVLKLDVEETRETVPPGFRQLATE